MTQCISSKVYAFIVTVIHNNIIRSGHNKNALEWNNDGKEALQFTSPSARGENLVVETEVEVEDDIDKYSLDMEIPSDSD